MMLDPQIIKANFGFLWLGHGRARWHDEGDLTPATSATINLTGNDQTFAGEAGVRKL